MHVNINFVAKVYACAPSVTDHIVRGDILNWPVPCQFGSRSSCAECSLRGALPIVCLRFAVSGRSIKDCNFNYVPVLVFL
jgi:hypothetical protein